MTREQPKTPQAIIEFDGLGTHWWIELLGRSNADISSVRKSVLKRVRWFEHTYTRFDQNSTIGRLNRTKRLKNPSAELLQMLGFARMMFEVSKGAFDITVGGRLAALGYGAHGHAKLIPDPWASILYTPDEVRLHDAISLDFGGFGKGWLIDDLCRLLQRLGHDSFVINGGGDILVHSPEHISIQLEHPLDPTRYMGVTEIRQGALACSSTTKRVWKDTTGQKHHHIIDPRTGRSTANGLVASFVKAPTALLADTCATIALLDKRHIPNLQQRFGADIRVLRRAQLQAV